MAIADPPARMSPKPTSREVSLMDLFLGMALVLRLWGQDERVTEIFISPLRFRGDGSESCAQPMTLAGPGFGLIGAVRDCARIAPTRSRSQGRSIATLRAHRQIASANVGAVAR